MHSYLETWVWSRSEKPFDFKLLLFEISVLGKHVSAYHILFREDIAVKGEADCAPLYSLLTHEDSLNSESFLCSYCDFFFKLQKFCLTFSVSNFPEKIFWTATALINVIRSLP